MRYSAAIVAAVVLTSTGCTTEPTSIAGNEAAVARQSTAFQSQGQSASAGGDHFYASSERFGYTGSVSVYDTWADAKSGRNARCSDVAWPQRDGALFVVRNAPEYYIDNNVVLTNWFANDGRANPSNVNEGFAQMADENADTWQNQSAWWSKDLETFTVTVKGRNATYPSREDPQDYARLWNACGQPGSGEVTRGTFLTYDYELVAIGLSGIENPKGFYRNTKNATDYSGYFRGIFRNESTTSPTSNGYYVFDLRFNNISWAAARNLGWGGPTLPDEFGSSKKQ
ncbi:MAG TPA: hypothetical protein VGJ96_11540 [Gemmatimonadaceae bacterium]|jgi:hypothetical protein